MVDHPFSTRVNTKDNTPAVIHTEIVPGDKLAHHRRAEGRRLREHEPKFQIMLPSRGKEGITEFVLQTIEESGGNPCPPLVVGVGVGGSSEYAMYLAKKAHHRAPSASRATTRRRRSSSASCWRR